MSVNVEPSPIGSADEGGVGVSLRQDVYGGMFETVVAADTRQGWVIQKPMEQVGASSHTIYE